VSYLFDTDAISEVWRPRPNPAYLKWLTAVPLESQYVSAVSVGELYKGAYRSTNAPRYLTYIEERLLSTVTVLPYDVAVAKVFGQVRAELESQGNVLEDADLQIAATAIYHGLALVTGNVRHFSRVPGLTLHEGLAGAR
jgi:predicted nucleic acid-binding protein